MHVPNFLNRDCLNYVILLCLLVCSFTFITSAESEKEIPTTKLSHVGGPTMTFLYCYSCGYRKAYEDYVHIIKEKYPNIAITGANYDPPGFNMYFSKSIFALKVVLIALIVSSYNIFTYFGMQTPSWWNHLLQNKLYASMMIFFVGNMLESQLVSSGAFEIILNDVPVWSKLQTGRIPSPHELFQIIDSQVNFGDPTPILNENSEFVK